MKMKNLSKRRKIIIVLVIILSALLTILLYQISAASGSITASSSAQSVTLGKTFTTTVTVDVDSPVTIAQAAVNYDHNALQLNTISYAGSPLTQDSPESSNNPGALVISRYKVGNPYPTGKFTLATLTFTAKDTGNTAITLSQNRSLLFEATEESLNVLTQVSGTSVTVADPPVSNPKPSEPTSPNEPAPAATNNTDSSSGSTNTQTTDSSGQSTTEQSDATPAAIVEEQPDNNLPAPGASIRATNLSLSQRVGQLVRNIVPALVMISVAGFIGWLIVKRFGHHSSFSGYKAAQAGGPGVVFDGSHTVKTNQDNNQQPPSPLQ
jgi:hypothetical protein